MSKVVCALAFLLLAALLAMPVALATSPLYLYCQIRHSGTASPIKQSGPHTCNNCDINPTGTSASPVNIGPTNPSCTPLTCNYETDPACCREGSYTWHVFLGQNNNPTQAISSASGSGTVIWTVDYDTSQWCTDTCAGQGSKHVGWNLPGLPGRCCGVVGTDYAIPCDDNGEGYCSTPTTTDEEACCTGGSGTECVYSGSCYPQGSQNGEWRCGVQSTNVWHDTVDPVSSINPNGNSWTNNNVAFTIGCTDGGSGCASRNYKVINSGATCGTTGFTSSSSGTVTCPADSVCRRRVCYYSTDNGGNQESTKTSNIFYIDKEDPSTSLTPSGTSIGGGWYGSNVNIILSCSDGSGSGCSNTRYCVDQSNSCTPASVYSGQFQVTNNGTNYVRYYSTDSVGNSESVHSTTIKIDKTPQYEDYDVSGCGYIDSSDPGNRVCWVKENDVAEHAIEYSRVVDDPAYQIISFTEESCTSPGTCGGNDEIRSRVEVNTGTFMDLMTNDAYIDVQAPSCASGFSCSSTAVREEWPAVAGSSTGKFKVWAKTEYSWGGSPYTYTGWLFGIDNTLPVIRFSALPVWTKESQFNVQWSADPDDTGIASFELQYKVADYLGSDIISWTPWSTGEVGGSSVPGSAIFGQTPPGNDPLLENNRTYSLRIRATDGVGNVGNWYYEDVTTDFLGPVCTMTPLPRYSMQTFQLVWNGDDAYQSGIDTYEVQVSVDSGAWQDAFTSGICTSTGATSATCTGVHGSHYDFRTRATDNAGNTGDWSALISTTVDATEPVTTMTQPPAGSKWTNSTVPYPPLKVELKWQSTYDISPLECFNIKWRNCTHVAGPGSDTCAPGDWGQWYYIADDVDGHSSECIVPAPADCSSGTCYGVIVFNGTGIDPSTGNIVRGTINFNAPIFDFAIWSRDEAGNTESPPAGDPIIDAIPPKYDYDIFDDKGNSIKGRFAVSSDETESVNITSVATDTQSGVNNHQIDYCVTQANAYFCGIYDAGPADEWGGQNKAWLTMNYPENTVLKYRINVRDRAGNWNKSQYFFVATHELANFVTHNLFLSLGQSYDLRVQARNLQNKFDNITILLDGYQLAYFLNVSGAELIAGGRGLKVGLNPYEERMFYVRVVSAEVTNAPVWLNLTATSKIDANLLDEDAVSIMISYPASFPGLAEWAMVILVFMSAAIYWKMGTKI